MSENNYDFSQFDPDQCPIFENFDGTESVGETVKKLAFYMNVIQGLLVPDVAGVIKPYAGKGLPQGYVYADGSSYSPTTYPSLFEAIGYCYGYTLDSSNNKCFKVPDYRGVSLVGRDLGANCIKNLVEYQGFNSNGDPVNGDVIGAKHVSCNTETDYSDNCNDVSKKVLVDYIISTGEICV